MKKGIVMEIEDEFLTLLTPDGQFFRAKKRPCVLGEEISFTPLKKQTVMKRFIGIKQLSAAAVLFLVLAASLLPMYQNQKAYAFMSIDVNPSIELGINKNMQVIKLTPYNDDGKKIISHLGSWKKTDITSLSKSILSEMKAEGYFKKKHDVVISTVRTEKPEEKTEGKLKKNIEKIKKMVEENKLDPILINGSEQDMEKAHRLGITTGKYKEEKEQLTKHHEQKENNQGTKKNTADIEEQTSVNQEQQAGEKSNLTSSDESTSPITNSSDQSNNSSQSGNTSSTGAVNHTPASAAQINKAKGVDKQQTQAPSTQNQASNEKKTTPVNKGQLRKQDNSHAANPHNN